VYIEGSPTTEEASLGVMPKGDGPQILYVPTVPMEIFLSLKWERSKETKRELCTEAKGRVPILRAASRQPLNLKG